MIMVCGESDSLLILQPEQKPRGRRRCAFLEKTRRLLSARLKCVFCLDEHLFSGKGQWRGLGGCWGEGGDSLRGHCGICKGVPGD